MSALRRLAGQVPGVGGWDEDPLWGSVYDWSVEHPVAGGALWRLGIGSDLRLLYAAAGETGRLPAGSVVLDVPSGGGVALRGLRPGQGVRYVAVDISQRMLDRTAAAARRLGVADQLETVLADVGRPAARRRLRRPRRQPDRAALLPRPARRGARAGAGAASGRGAHRQRAAQRLRPALRGRAPRRAAGGPARPGRHPDRRTPLARRRRASSR